MCTQQVVLVWGYIFVYIDKTYLSSSGHSDRCDPWSFFTDPYHHMSGLLMKFLFEKINKNCWGGVCSGMSINSSKKPFVF